MYVTVAAPVPTPAAVPTPLPATGGRVGASPLAKKLAAEKGIDLQVLHSLIQAENFVMVQGPIHWVSAIDFLCLAPLNVNSPIEMHGTYSVADKITNANAQYEWTLSALKSVGKSLSVCILDNNNKSLLFYQLIQGTGPGGTVRAQDVEGFVPSAAAPVAAVGAPRPTPVPGATYTDIPLSNIRKVLYNS